MKFLAALLALLTPLAAQPGRFGIPACSAPDQELAIRSSFILCHSSSRKVPVWVIYELTPPQLHGQAARPKHFRHDYQLSGTGSYDSDYRASGFNRGHMVPSADAAWSEASIQETFLLSNAVPQRAQVNSGKWSKLEQKVRELAADSDALYIITGPLFESDVIETIGRSLVAVPTHTFKVVLSIQGSVKTMYAAILPNSAEVREPLENYSVSVDEVQHRTGLDFFNTLQPTEQHRLESARNIFPITR